MTTHRQPRPGDPGDGGRDDPYLRLTDDARLDQAVHERRQLRLRRQRDVDLASLIGTARDLAERGRRVTVQTTTGRRHQGTLTGVGADHLSLRGSQHRMLHVSLEAVAALQPEPGHAADAARSDRAPGHDRRLAEVLAGLAADRPDVLVAVVGGGQAFEGRLTGVGDDVVTVTAEPPGGVVYLHLPAVSEVVVLP